MNVKLLRAEWRAVRRATLRLTHHSLSMVGLVAVAGVAVVATHPDSARALGRWVMPGEVAAPPVPVVKADPLGDAIGVTGNQASRLLGLAETTPAPAADVPGAPADGSRAPVVLRSATARQKQEAVVYLSKKYRVNSDAIALLVDTAYTTGKDLDLDPLLLLAVMGVESGFNPFAESTAGASGLMQLMSKIHRDKLADFGGPNIALNPVVNLRVGALVLKDCIRRGGSIADGLRLYVGAGNGDDSGYGARVLQEKDRLAQAIRGVGSSVTRPSIEPIPSTTAKARLRQPDIDHSFDNGDPAAKIDPRSGSVAAL